MLDTRETTTLATRELDALVFGALELLGGLEAGLDLHGEVDFLGGGEQIDLADLLQVHAHRITREHDDRACLDTGLACLGTALLGIGRLLVAADPRSLHRLGSLGLHGFFGLLDAHGLARGTELVFGDALHDLLVAHGGVDILVVIDLDDLHALARELDAVGLQVLEDRAHLLAR